ncbi:helix-turn-helix transcriptional regulator [Fulvivirga sp. 29W222]|uniref:Helix-turn-helix transcriptional regulator n=1 Tax=Fulvivirga marina TaxID=2494733 RepID=A0A937G129_9BACT|nr:helix-turn-helix transcriptional regulator [Fulvivirga marina]
MNKLHQLSEQKREQLERKLKENSISKKELASRAGVTQRAVSYFFAGRSNSRKIHNAAIQMLNEKLNAQIYQIQCNHTDILKLQTA